MDSDSFHAIALILQPQCIILDDFDRGCTDETMFEALAFLRKHVKLIIATANNRSQIDEALLRPGRFDELGCIKTLDELVIRKILGQHQDVFEDVKTWPIVFIEEYVTRRKFQTHEEATQSMLELAERVRRLEHYDNDNEAVNITAIKPQSNKQKLLAKVSF
jgi:SpoVK/Ycf46/Vps4 family AAA+-type ATPase